MATTTGGDSPKSTDTKSLEELFELSLPEYLKNDILALEKGRRTNSTVLDCLYCEVQGSINMAFYGNAITWEEANSLRRKYLGLEV